MQKLIDRVQEGWDLSLSQFLNYEIMSVFSGFRRQCKCHVLSH